MCYDADFGAEERDHLQEINSSKMPGLPARTWT